MRIRPLLLLLLVPLMGMKKCEREVAPAFTLPPATQAGANTFGFVVDGRVWRNYGWLPYTSAQSDNLRGSYVPVGQFRLLAGLIDRDRYETVTLEVDSMMSTGTYQVNGTNGAPVPGAVRRADRYLIFSVESQAIQSSYNVSPRGTPTTVTVTTLDTAKYIVAGTFNGTLRLRTDSTKQVRITDGRFDIKYR